MNTRTDSLNRNIRTYSMPRNIVRVPHSDSIISSGSFSLSRLTPSSQIGLFDTGILRLQIP